MSLSLYQLYLIKEKMQEENLTQDENYKSLCERISNIESLLEDGGGTSATGGPSVGGMGAVVNAQPSGLAGQTIGTNWASNGGTVGSGDVSVPYNPSGANRVFQKIPANTRFVRVSCFHETPHLFILVYQSLCPKRTPFFFIILLTEFICLPGPQAVPERFIINNDSIGDNSS